MKYLKKIFESSDEDVKRDILDNFQYITDVLGNPVISSEHWGDLKKWIVKWNIGLDVTDLNEASVIINKLKSIVENLDDVLSAEERMSDFSFQIQITNILLISICPKDSGDDDYKFIRNQEWRNVYIRKSEVERFLIRRGVKITKIEEKNYGGEDSNSLSFSISIENNDAVLQFCVEFNNQARLSGIDRNIRAYGRGRNITITPEEEKTYIIAI